LKRKTQATRKDENLSIVDAKDNDLMVPISKSFSIGDVNICISTA
jgi:hypothetical protein